MHPHSRSKRQLIGNPAALVHPAWKLATNSVAQQSKDKHRAEDIGSKILLSRLPADVGENEIEELFKKTVGPLKESFLIYNSQGKSKGMAVVSFQRPGDAAVARTKYHGKIVDGRRPIKLEIVVDKDSPTSISPGPTLLSRLGVFAATKDHKNATSNGVTLPAQPKTRHSSAPIKPTSATPSTSTRPASAPLPPRRVRHKKGPRRVKKSRDQLDKEMEDYRAAADIFSSII